MKNDREQGRARSLRILESLSIGDTKSKFSRTAELLVANDYRGVLEKTKCLDPSWAFWLGPWFRESLDIRETPRVVKGESQDTTTQGPNFEFVSGATIYDTGAAYAKPWGDALKNIQRCLQVNRSTAASVRATSHGLVEFTELEPNADHTRLVARRDLSMTQHQFVHFLIKGELVARDKTL